MYSLEELCPTWQLQGCDYGTIRGVVFTFYLYSTIQLEVLIPRTVYVRFQSKKGGSIYGECRAR